MILDSLANLFKNSSEKGEPVYKDILLRQGDLFLSFQDNYYQKVAPHFSLMEKTSGKNVQSAKSVIEGLSNPISAKIKELEQKYNMVLNQYIETSKQLAHLNVKNMKKESITALHASLIKYNDQLVHIAKSIYKTIEQSTNTEPKVEDKKKKLVTTISELKEHKNKLNSASPTMETTYHGNYSDNGLRVNYAYYHYIVWFLIVIILISAITMTMLNIPYPFMRWPWSLGYVFVILFILWMGAKAIGTKFWRNVT